MNNKNYTERQININDILLNIENPRFERISNQEKALEIMLSEYKEKIYNLAKHITENGMNPTELSAVIKTDNNKYTILDGNRRLKDIIRKIRLIHNYKEQVQFYNMDAIDFLKTLNEINYENNPFIFLDPPYFKKGPGLYTNFYTKKDHEKLADYVSNLNHNWIVTYDNVDKIRKIYKKHDLKCQEYSLRYSANNKCEGTEVMFYSNNLIPINF